VVISPLKPLQARPWVAARYRATEQGNGRHYRKLAQRPGALPAVEQAKWYVTCGSGMTRASLVTAVSTFGAQDMPECMIFVWDGTDGSGKYHGRLGGNRFLKPRPLSMVRTSNCYVIAANVEQWCRLGSGVAK